MMYRYIYLEGAVHLPWFKMVEQYLDVHVHEH